MPAELTFDRAEYGWPSDAAFRAAQHAWLVEHGIEPSDWNTLAPVLRASKRAHARRADELDALARLWWRETRKPDAPFEPPWPWERG